MRFADKIKASIVSFALATSVCCVPAGLAFADGETSGTVGAEVTTPEGVVHKYEWEVSFVGDKMVETGEGDFSKMISGLQPGSSVEFVIYLNNDCDEEVDWWMWNKVWKTMEEAQKANKNGGYTYELYFYDDAANVNSNDPADRQVLYSNQQVGGEDIGANPDTEVNPGAGSNPNEPYAVSLLALDDDVAVADDAAAENANAVTGGLFNATQRSGMEDFFHLGTFQPLAKKALKLVMAIDGETHDNSYFDTVAGTQFRFAAEPVAEPGTIIEYIPPEPEYVYGPGRTIGAPLPQTGDMLPGITALCLFAGCILLAIAGASYVNDRREMKGAKNDVR